MNWIHHHLPLLNLCMQVLIMGAQGYLLWSQQRAFRAFRNLYGTLLDRYTALSNRVYAVEEKTDRSY